MTSTSRYDDERSRAAEQSQLAYLQGQIDELRRQIKEQTSKFQLAIDNVRKVENATGQIELGVERHRHEMIQALDASRRDIVALRKDVAAALVKVDEMQRPIREMQSQIHQVAEARKQDRDSVAGWLLRIEDLESHVRDWGAQLQRTDERYRDVAGRFEGLYTADEALRVELRKVSEDLQVEKQSLRRQIVEAQQLVTSSQSALDDLLSRIGRLDEIRHQIEMYSAQLPGRIDSVEVRVTDLVGDLKRIERVDGERFLLNQERLEDLRRQQEDRAQSLAEVGDQHQRQLTSWIERVDSAVRGLELRLLNAVTRIEDAQREHAGHLVVLEQRDVQLVDTLLGALRDRAEKVKTEQIERGTIEPRRPE